MQESFSKDLGFATFNRLLKRFWKKQLIFNAIIKSQFSFCPLEWMFCSRQTNMINTLHERALGIALKDYISDFFWGITSQKQWISSHHRNIQMLMIELYKIKNEVAPPITYSMLNRRNAICNFRNLQEFQLQRFYYFWWSRNFKLQYTLNMDTFARRNEQRNTIILSKAA